MKQNQFCLTFLFTLLLLFHHSQMGWSQTARNPRLATWLETAHAENPTLQAQARRVAAMRETIPQASALPDPMLGFEYERIPDGTFDLKQSQMNMTMISQAVPFPTKLLLKRQAATQTYETEQAAYRMIENALTRDVKEAFYQLAALDEAIRILARHTQVLEQLEGITRIQYEVGKKSVQATLKAQVERAELENELIRLKEQRAVAEAKANTLRNLPVTTPIDPILTFTAEENHHPLTALIPIMLTSQPHLAMAHTQAARANTQQRLAKAEGLPNFNFKFDQRYGKTGSLGHDVTGALTLPLWFWQSELPAIREATQTFEQAKAEAQAAENNTHLQLRKAYEAHTAAKERFAHYQQTIVPKAKQSFLVSQTAYEAGDIDFLTLLDAERMVRRFETALVFAKRDVGTSYAMLEEAVGTNLLTHLEKGGTQP